jgi:hypothetical protein
MSDATLVDLAFSGGDLVPLKVADGVYDLSVASDNEALTQSMGVLVNTHVGLNQYSTSAGWKLYNFMKGDFGVTEITDACKQLKALAESIDYVSSAKCEYMGYNQLGSLFEHIFRITAETSLGTLVQSYAVGGSANA